MKGSKLIPILLSNLFIIFTFIGDARAIEPSMPGVESIQRYYTYCYNIVTLELLNCQYNMAINGIPLSGGHDHNSADRPFGGLRVFGAVGSGQSAITGQTENKVVGIEYVVPEVAGIVNLTKKYVPPPGYYCVFPPNCTDTETLNIMIPGLVPFPPSGSGVWDLTGSYGSPGVTSMHINNHYGTYSTHWNLTEIALRFSQLTNGARRLGINDMSLQSGGIFDIHNNWNPPHITHRRGTDVDIDRGGVDCKDDEDLKNAIENTRGTKSYPRLLCESGGRKHIYLDK